MVPYIDNTSVHKLQLTTQPVQVRKGIKLYLKIRYPLIVCYEQVEIRKRLKLLFFQYYKNMPITSLRISSKGDIKKKKN